MAYSCVRVHFEIGHEASLRNKKTPNGFTHDWEVFVRGADGTDIHHFVDKVVFHLHSTFSKPTRSFKEPPYSLKESGYAGFSLPIDIYLKKKDEHRKLTYYYDLVLPTSGTTKNVNRHTMDFPNPSEDFRRKLIRGGGIGIGSDGASIEKSHNSSNSHLDDLKSSPHSGLKNKLNNNVDQPKKHKPKPEEVRCTNAFAALFGPPIKTGKHSPIPKAPSKSSLDSKVSHEIKAKESSSKSSKHSPHKDKERDKESKREKDGDRGKEKERIKDKESHREKDKKLSKKSASPLPPPLPPPKEVRKEDTTKKSEESNREREKSSKSESKIEKKHKDKKSREEKERKREEKHKEYEKKEKEDEKEKERKIEPPPQVHLPIIKDIKEPKESKHKDKINDKEEKKIKHKKDKEKHEEGKHEKQKHKHKKKDKHKKDEEKVKKEKFEKPEVIQKPIKPKSPPPPPPREKSVTPPRSSKGTVNPLNMLFQELSDKDDDSDFSGSMEEEKEPPSLIDSSHVLKPKIEGKNIEVKEEKKERREKKKIKDKEKDVKKRKRKSKDKEDQPMEKIIKVEPKEEKIERISPPKIEEMNHSRSLSRSLSKSRSRSRSRSRSHSRSRSRSRSRSPSRSLSHSPSPDSLFTDAYVTQLKDLQHKIMTLQDNADLQKVVQVISETGRFEITQRTFDFDLCALDKSTVKRLQDMFVVAS